MFITVTTGNDSGAFNALCPNQKNDTIAKPAQTLQTLFAIGLTLVFNRE